MPSTITAATCFPGGENYIFLSTGSAGTPGRYVLEVKITLDSYSIHGQPTSGGNRLR